MVPVVEQLAEAQGLSETQLQSPLGHSSRCCLLAQGVRLTDGRGGLRANPVLVLSNLRGNPEKRALSRYRSIEEVLGGLPAGASREDEHATVECVAKEATHEHQIGSFGARLTRDQTVADGVWTKVVFNEVVSHL